MFKRRHALAERQQPSTPRPRGLVVWCVTALLLVAPGDVGAQATDEQGAVDAAQFRAPSEGGVRRWRVAPSGALPLRRSRSEDAPVVSMLPEGAILSSFGCETAAGRLWCAVRPYRGGRRGFALAERLTPARAPDGTTPRGADDSKARARKRDFDATSEIACAQEQGQALGLCAAGVARGGGGDATVAAMFPNGFARQLFFIHGAFVSASATMSGAGRDVDWRLVNGVHHIRVDDQRFEIPDVFVFGDGG